VLLTASEPGALRCEAPARATRAGVRLLKNPSRDTHLTPPSSDLPLTRSSRRTLACGTEKSSATEAIVIALRDSNRFESLRPPRSHRCGRFHSVRCEWNDTSSTSAPGATCRN
jgi:hypothetical protein